MLHSATATGLRHSHMYCLQLDGYYYYQWWRRLVNAYEVKAGMVCLQCKNCVI